MQEAIPFRDGFFYFTSVADKANRLVRNFFKSRISDLLQGKHFVYEQS
ncbi:MAG: hypothetical protein RL007_321 [Bacteroidota bacterium]|jgi:hypothetical protein